MDDTNTLRTAAQAVVAIYPGDSEEPADKAMRALRDALAAPQTIVHADVERDAARYRRLRGGRARTAPPSKRTVGRIEVIRWSDPTEADVLKGDALDAAVDADIIDAARQPSTEGDAA